MRYTPRTESSRLRFCISVHHFAYMPTSTKWTRNKLVAQGICGKTAFLAELTERKGVYPYSMSPNAKLVFRIHVAKGWAWFKYRFSSPLWSSHVAQYLNEKKNKVKRSWGKTANLCGLWGSWMEDTQGAFYSSIIHIQYVSSSVHYGEYKENGKKP